MRFLRIDNKLLILNGRDPLKYVDLTTKNLYKYPNFEIAVAYKWWRNPIRWYQSRKLWKKINNIPEVDTYRLNKLWEDKDESKQ